MSGTITPARRRGPRSLSSLRCSIIGNGYTRRSAMSVPSSLKPRTLSPFGGVYGIGGSSMRPVLIGYSPQRVTSGSLLELQYWGKHSSLPVLLSISWLPQHGHTSVRFLPEDLSENISTFRIAIEVPLGATSAIVIDQSGGQESARYRLTLFQRPRESPCYVDFSVLRE